MNLEILQKDKIKAMKEGAALKKEVLTDMIDSIQKASITPKGRVEITEELVNEALIKYQKMTQEMIDTCPESRVQTLAIYNARMDIVKEYAPQLVVDEAEITNMITSMCEGIEMTKKNRGQIMKTIMPQLKGKVDMSIANKVIGSMLK
jgi:uncharacterized protein YqeY